MTQLHSTIYRDIDFKLRCVQHWQKCYFKRNASNDLKEMMIRQSKRALDEIASFYLKGDKELTEFANEKFKEYKLKPIKMEIKKENK